MATIAILGTMDTKGDEHGFIAEILRQKGHVPFVIDVGTLDAPRLKPDVTRDQVLAAIGTTMEELSRRKDRGESVAAMVKAAPVFLKQLVDAGKIAGVISLGGGGGTAIGTSAMRALPVGFPKVMVSTLAGGNVTPYVGTKDIVMFPSIVDVAGINRISRQILSRAAGAIAGMVETVPPAGADRPIIAASQFGNTTRCVDHARQRLEKAGYEVVVFHATGVGGKTMEALIESGMVAGVLDITTTEWADEFVGGILGAGPTRLEAAARGGVPAIVTPGCLDMVNFGSPDTVPARFKGRRFYPHNPQVTLMRTTPEECAMIGAIIAEKLNLSKGPVSVLLPLKAISIISAPGQTFHDAEADRALFASIKAGLRSDIAVKELDCEINDPAFAEACADELLTLLARKKGAQKA